MDINQLRERIIKDPALNHPTLRLTQYEYEQLLKNIPAPIWNECVRAAVIGGGSPQTKLIYYGIAILVPDNADFEYGLRELARFL